LRIAVDIMGGDYAPEQIGAGTLAAAQENPRHAFILVGTEQALADLAQLPPNVEKFSAGSVMAMDEPVANLTGKKDSSIWLATQLVKKGQAQAVVSAGSTAAQMASALLLLGRIKGISRPAIVGIMPSLAGPRVLLDIGANADCKPEMLLQFALMGQVYAQEILGLKAPRVALLSNGSEDHKGNELVKAAHQLLCQNLPDFVGNKEGRDLAEAKDFEVMVCDGFTGNIVLKTMEGTAQTILGMLKEQLGANFRHKAGAALIMPGLKKIKRQMDYAEYGGAPLLGVKGISIICHGSSKAYAIQNAVNLAISCLEQDFAGKIERTVEKTLTSPVAN
jgi:glycerol-3-phosphate acyltransferase PlsX